MATDFIYGAKLSLLSKSNIRYEGILHDFDKTDSTISLKDGNMFNNEGSTYLQLL
jgi:hypothetical protein